MENMAIKIQKKSAGQKDDGYRVFSVRIRATTLNSLEELSRKSNRSRNELISIMLDYGVEHCKIVE